VKGLRSLKARFIVGSVLWTLGLLGASHLAFVFGTRYFPHVLVIQHWTVLGVLALVFMLGGLSQVRRGLSPVNELRTRLVDLRQGRARRVDGNYPSELQPLVDDLNGLLEHREDAVRRAQAKAGDLAHGLKTPLAVLAQDIDEVARSGHAELATGMRHELERMRRQIDYHLAHARAAASSPSPGTRTAVAPSIEGIVRTMRRLHADRGLDIDVRLGDAPEVAVVAERQDLDEMIGNLLDNACKWARSRVTVSVGCRSSHVAITIDDDGPGLGRAQCDAVLSRGVRADGTTPGSGLGLAIALELARIYDGRIMLDGEKGGGLSACLLLSSADTARASPHNDPVISAG
jgi:signal transduction histidine kinase